MSEAIFAALAVALAAFYMWLGVRIVNRREKWARRTAVVLAVVLAYPMSMGPILWLDRHGLTPDWTRDIPLYSPFQWMRDNWPGPIRDAINSYLAFWR
ncbi:MAG TPA: hypothetical protein VGH74_17540 [Planctomycetaceae bacterium]|jgi:hypothetical protein